MGFNPENRWAVERPLRQKGENAVKPWVERGVTRRVHKGLRMAAARDESRAAVVVAAVRCSYRCAVPPGTPGAGFPSAPGAEPPMNTFRPSGYSKKTATALFSPLLA